MKTVCVSHIHEIMLKLPSEADSVRKICMATAVLKPRVVSDQDTRETLLIDKILSNKVLRTAGFLPLNHLYLSQEIVKYSLDIDPKDLLKCQVVLEATVIVKFRETLQ